MKTPIATITPPKTTWTTKPPQLWVKARTSARRPAASVLSDVVNSTVQSLQQSEKMSVAAAAGKADIVDVVSSVTNAEVTLQAVVAVRDKVIEAYQDIMKMPI